MESKIVYLSISLMVVPYKITVILNYAVLSFFETVTKTADLAKFATKKYIEDNDKDSSE